MTSSPRTCVVIGTGRAGGSFAGALTAAGWDVELLSSRPVPAVPAAQLVILAIADHAIAEVARALPPTSAVVVHVSGASGLGVLAPHERVGSMHPLMSLPDPVNGAARLLDHCTFAVDGDPFVNDVVATLGGRAVAVPDEQRALYHATAAVAANHLTALCAQVERLAAHTGVPVDAYWTMMSATLAGVGETGAAAALTGPAARGDWETVRAHLAALPVEERPLYSVMFRAAARLARQQPPADLAETS